MRYFNRYLLVFLLIFFVSYSANAYEVVRGVCVRVHDGDTMDMVSEGEHELFRVRFWGIDAPETSQPYGLAARRSLANMILGKEVQVHILSVDLYGRCVGDVFLNSQNVNQYMLRQGLAWYYERYARNEDRFRQEEASARRLRKGLWAGVLPEAPWNYRRRARSGGKRMVLTPLVMAAICGHVEVVKYLIEAGADADGVGGKLALLAAIRNNRVDVVRCLLESGVDVRTDNAVYNHECAEPASVSLSDDNMTGRCFRVPDGDSIDVSLTSGNFVRVHLWGVDAPELLQAHGAEAHQFLTELLAGEDVRVRVLGTDGNGGYVGQVYKGEECVNLQVLSHGWGWLNVQHGVSKPEYARAWQDACNRNCGLWAAGGVVNPQEVRGQDVLVNPAGSVALSLSIALGNEEVTDLLRKHGVELSDDASHLPMAYAARHSRAEQVARFANNGAPINGRVNGEAVGRRTLLRINEQSRPSANGNETRFSIISETIPDTVSHGIRDEVYGLGYPESTIPAIQEDATVSPVEDILIAAYNGDLGRIKAYVEDGGNINTAVDVSASSVLSPCLSNMQFLENEANLEIVLGTTPIMEAAKRGNLEVVRTLISNGANLGEKDAFNTNATQHAEENGRREVVQELRRRARASTPVSSASRSTPPSIEVPRVTTIPNPVTTPSSTTVENGTPRTLPASSVERTSGLLFEPTINRTSTTSRTSVPRSQPRRSSGRTYSGGYSRQGDSHFRINTKWYLIGGFVLFLVLVILCFSCIVECLFILAAKRKTMFFVRLFFLFGLKYNPKDTCRGFSPLCVAVSCNNIELVKFLLKKGANPNICTKSEAYPIQIAVKSNNFEMVKLLLENGAKPDTSINGNDYPIQTAVSGNNLGMVKILLENGANPNICTKREAYPIQIAVKSNNFEMAKLLLEKGADPNIYKTWTVCPLLAAVSSSNLELVKLLLEKGANPNIFKEREVYLIQKAVSDDNLELVKLLLENGANPNICTKREAYPIQTAVKSNNCEMVKLLLEKGADPNIYKTRTVCPLRAAVSSSNLEMAKLLLENGANPNICTKSEAYLIQIAVKSNNFEMVKLLLEKGADPNIYKKWTVCPLRAAVSSNNLEMAKLLLENGANPNICTKSEAYPIQIAVKSNNFEMVKLLLENGAKPDTSINGNDYPIQLAVSNDNLELLKLLVENGANPNIYTFGKGYPIQIAVSDDNLELVKLLRVKGASLTILDDNGYNLYEIACLKHRYDIAEWLEDIGISARDINSFIVRAFSYEQEPLELIDYLWSKVEAIDSPSCSILYTVLKNSNLKLAEILINKGANIEYLLCCLDKAIHSKEDKIAEFLIINGANVFYRPKGSITLLYKALKKGMPRVAELIREVGGKMYAWEQDKYCMERAINYSSNKPLKKVEKIDFSFFN